ncbi:MAG: hypothetical protein IJ519_06120, partial [Clostridia bacterium]|nr:hypothetical protein [Clostridia bacterium]
MMRRLFVFILTFCMLFAALPVESAYFTPVQLATLEKQMSERCDEIFKSVYHPGYLDGGCAAWTSDQLIRNNIGYWYKGRYSYGYDDGNKWFADLDEGAVTDTGYTQVKYPGENAITELIAEYGSHPIYNVVVSWQRGNGKWVAEGHVLYIWCIYDGYVYYTDTFNQQFGDAGHIVKRTVENFIQLYDQISGPMIGAVHFAGDEAGGFRSNENIYSEYIAVEDCVLRTSPLEVSIDADEDTVPVAAGESISVIGAYTDDYDQRWLRVEGGKWVKEAQVAKKGNYSTIICEGITIPQVWMVKHGFTMAGSVTSHGGA